MTCAMEVGERLCAVPCSNCVSVLKREQAQAVSRHTTSSPRREIVNWGADESASSFCICRTSQVA
jgi:hypothetical protein